MKPLLCHKYNISWGIENPDSPDFFINQNTGRFEGDLFNSIVKTKFFLRKLNDDMSEFYKYCSFKTFKTFGQQIKNESGVYYSGVIGELIDNKIDASFKPGDYFMDDKLVDFTKHIYNEPYLSIQFVKNQMHLKKKNFAEFFSIFMPSLTFLAEYIALFFLGSLIAIIFLSISLKMFFSFRKFIGLILIFTFFKKINLKKSDFLAMFMIFLILYKFLIQQTLQNNIKTNKVLVDVSSIVTSKEKLVYTSKTACFIEDSKTIDFFRFAPKGTLAHFVYNKLSSSEDRCFMMDGLHFIKLKKELTSYLFFVFGSFASTCMSIYSNFYQSDVFLNTNPYFDVLMTLYIRKSLPKETKKYLDACLENVSEFGIMINVFRAFDVVLKKKFPSNYNSYYSIEEYVQQFTQISNLDFNSFEIVFHLLIFLNLTILLLYIFSNVSGVLNNLSKFIMTKFN